MYETELSSSSTPHSSNRPVTSPIAVGGGHQAWVEGAGVASARATIEAPKMLSEVRSGDGCPLSSRLGSLGSVVSSPSGVRGGDPANNAFLAFFGSQNTSGTQKNPIFCQV